MILAVRDETVLEDEHPDAALVKQLAAAAQHAAALQHRLETAEQEKRHALHSYLQQNKLLL